MTNDLILKNVRVWGVGESVDVVVKDGIVAKLISPTTRDKSGKGVGDDFGGRVLLPGFVESHCHLDKTMSLADGSLQNHSGTLLEAVQSWYPSKITRNKEDFKRRATHALNQAIAKGTTFLRSHLDMDKAKGLEVL